ncbi:MAG: hypothetical protein QOJ58_5933, partial [Alphaproteobacteria bacterium]|nr:hypothetical protein [Alphaproteobacteria bacterium]
MTDNRRGKGGRVDVSRGLADATCEYVAFISYSHALDGALAPALQTGLERFAKPWYRPRALRVFRDTTNLAANPDLWSSIEDALASSAWMVLMASPDAARSKGVDREVAWWLENKSPQRLLVVLTEGEFVWDDGSESVDGATAALPPALRGGFVDEPRWVDLRGLHDVGRVDQSNPRLRECVADVAATLRGVPKDMLVGEHIRQHRRTLRLARGAVIALVMLLIAAVVAAVVAVGQRNQAVEAQHATTVRAMVAEVDRIRDLDPRRALQLGVAANQLDAKPWTQGSLTQTLMSSRYRGTLASHTDYVNSVAFSSDGHTVATGSDDQTIILWDVTDRGGLHQLGQPLTGHTGPVRAVAFSPDGRALATASGDKTVILWDFTDRNHPHPISRALTGLTNGVSSVAFSPDGHTLATGGNDNAVMLWDLTDRNQPHRLGQSLAGHTHVVNAAMAFSPDGHTLATSGNDNAVILWDLTDRNQP